MTSPRYVPRSFAVDPTSFGRSFVLDWRSVELWQQDVLGASKLQNEFAVRIRRAVLASSYRSVKAYAVEAGTPYPRLAAVLRGEQIMRLEDLAVARRVLGDAVVAG